MIYDFKNLLNLRFNNLLLYVGLFFNIITNTSSAQDSANYFLQYKFRHGERFLYKAERHDSTIVSSDNKTDSTHTITWSLRSLTILDILTDKTYYMISVETDSVWEDQNQPPVENTSRIGVFKIDREPLEITIEITPKGKSVSKNHFFTPLLIPLPERNIYINETWDVEITTEHKSQRKGKTTITGQCLFYDLQKRNDTIVALIIFNAESRSVREFKHRMPQRKTKVSFESIGTSTSLIYFDIDRGCVLEVVSKEICETDIRSEMFFYKRFSKSTTTVELMSE